MYINPTGTIQYVGGVATYPSQNASDDGVIMSRRYIGHHSDGSFGLPANRDEGETLVHEIGHYLGLYHPFEGSCGGDLNDSAKQYLPNHGDLCYDTPPMSDSSIYTYTCNSLQNSCSESYFPLPDTNHTDPIHNYMGYQYDSCLSEFTPNQRDRMWATFETARKDLVSDYSIINAGISGNTDKVFFYALETNICSNDSLILKFNYISGAIYEVSSNSTILRPIGSITHDTIIIKNLSVGNYPITIKRYVFTFPIYNPVASSMKSDYVKVFNCATHATYQPEYSNWFFGNHTGLQFTNTGPRSLKTSALNGDEGSISQSKTNGSLLFYGGGEDIAPADSFKVYNRNHQQMPHSPIFGHASSAQGSIVLPILNDTNKYLLVTTDARNMGTSVRGLRSSVINMTLRGGNGDIDSSARNIIISHPTDITTNTFAENVFVTSEGITAIPICDSVGYWLLVASLDIMGTDKINVFRCDRDGAITFSSDYRLVNTGNGFPSGNIFFIKASPNGMRIGAGFSGSSQIYVYTFDKKTGVIDLNNPVIVDGSFDMSFSPNSELLYTNCEGCYPNNTINQYDLSINPPTVKTVVLLDTIRSSGNTLCHLQLASDSKIYYSNFNADYISAITLPNVKNITNTSNDCGFITKAVKLGNANPCDMIGAKNGLSNQIDALPSTSVSLKTITVSAKNCYDYCFKNYFCDNKKWILQNASGVAIDSVINADSMCRTLVKGRYFIMLKIGAQTITQMIDTRMPPFQIFGNDTMNYTNYNYAYTTNKVPFYTYKWKVITNGSITGVDNLDTVTIKALIKSSVVLRLIFTSPAGCKDSVDKTILFDSALNITHNYLFLPSYNYCIGDSIFTITATDPIGGTGVYTYQWQKSYSGPGGFYNIAGAGATSKDYVSDTTFSTTFLLRRIVYSGAKTDTSASYSVTSISLNVCDQRIWFNYTNTPLYSGCDFYVQGTTPTNKSYAWEYSFDNSTWLVFTASGGVSATTYHISKYFDSVFVRRKTVRSGITYYSNVILIYTNVKITVQPNNAVICGTNYVSAAFYCQFNMTPPYAEWYYYCSNTSSWHTYPFINGFSFYPSSTGLMVSFTDSIKVGFRGYCANGLQSDTLYSKTVEIFGLAPSAISTQPAPVTVALGSNTSFWVAVTNSSVFHTYQWYVSTNNGILWKAIPNTNNDSLIITANQSCMGGNKYKCVITTICTVLTTDSVLLTVIGSPAYDVWIKDYFDDNGNEPYPYTNWANVFGGGDIWNWFKHTPGAVDTLKHYNPDYSQKNDSNYIYCKIRNKSTTGAASIPTKLRLYWSFASTGELWDINWTENSLNMYHNPSTGKDYPLGREVTAGRPYIIPAIAANDSIIVKVGWIAPNTANYDQTDLRFCFLARIITCDGDEPKSMTYLETIHTGLNADSNNNIATRNAILVDSISNNLVYNGNGKGGNPINWSRINPDVSTAEYYTIEIHAVDSEFFNSAVVYLHMNDLLADAVQVSNDVTGATQLNPLLWLWSNPDDIVLSHLTLTPYEFYKVGLEFKLLGDTLAKTSTRKKLEYTTTYRIYMLQRNTKTRNKGEAVNFYVTIPGWRGLRPDTTTIQEPVKYEVIDNFKFTLRPNPANTMVNILYQLPQQAQTLITIYDINGKEVIDVFRNKTEKTGSYIVPVDISKLAVGTYIVKLKVNGKEYSQKLVRGGD